MYKLNVVEAQFNKKNLTEPWEINCVGQAVTFAECKIRFEPEHQVKSGFSLFAAKADLKTVFGRFSGYVSNHKGKRFVFENLKGVAEVVSAKW